MDMHLLLTAAQPLAHQDAGVGDTGNTLTFNRRGQIIYRAAGAAPTAEQVAAFCAAHPVPAEMWDALRLVKFPEFVAAAMVRVLVSQYSSREGVGLFSGIDRYEMLERRLTTAGVTSSTLQRLWVALCNGLQLPVHPESLDAVLLRFWGLPTSVQHAAVSACVEQARAIVSLARQWSAQTKLRSAEYAAAAGQLELVGAEMITPTFPVEEARNDNLPLIADVPVVSGNTLRHQLVRAPAWAHLTRSLGIPAEYAGEGSLPLAVESIFSNGGNIKAGAKQPSNTFALAGRIRRAFPSLDLLGGVTDSFDLSESALKPSAWLVCAENRLNLPDWLADSPLASISAFDMLDQITETRQATPNGVGQMIRSFEVLVPGVQIYVRLHLAPWTKPLTCGALAAALREHLANPAYVGGQSARGYGEVHIDICEPYEIPAGDRDAYEQYLADHREQLAMWMMDGTLGSGVTVCS